MAWPHALSIDVSASRLAKTITRLPMLFGLCPLNKIGNLITQIPTDLSQANPERPRLSIDLSHGTRSACGIAMPVNLSCQVQVDIK
jgi:hypothetical protein